MARPTFPSIPRDDRLSPPPLLRSQTWPQAEEHEEKWFVENHRACTQQEKQCVRQQEQLRFMHEQRQQREMQQRETQQQQAGAEEDAQRPEEQQQETKAPEDDTRQQQQQRIQTEEELTPQQQALITDQHIAQQNSAFAHIHADMQQISENKTLVAPAAEALASASSSAAAAAAAPLAIPAGYESTPLHPAPAVTEPQRSSAAAAATNPSAVSAMERQTAAGVTHATEADAAAGPAAAAGGGSIGGDMTGKTVQREDGTLHLPSGTTAAIAAHDPPTGSSGFNACECNSSSTTTDNTAAAGKAGETGSSCSSTSNNGSSRGRSGSGEERTCSVASSSSSAGHSSSNEASSSCTGSSSSSKEMLKSMAKEQSSGRGDDSTSHHSEQQRSSGDTDNNSPSTDSSNSGDDGENSSRKNEGDYIVHSMDEKTITFTYKGFLFSSVTRRKKRTRQRGEGGFLKNAVDNSASSAVRGEAVSSSSSSSTAEQDAHPAADASPKQTCKTQALHGAAAAATKPDTTEAATTAAPTAATPIAATPTAAAAPITAAGTSSATAVATTTVATAATTTERAITTATIAATTTATVATTTAEGPLRCLSPAASDATDAAPQTAAAAAPRTEVAASALETTSLEARGAAPASPNTCDAAAAAAANSGTQPIADSAVSSSVFWNISPRERRPCTVTLKKVAAAEATAASARDRHEAVRREMRYQEQQQQQQQQTREKALFPAGAPAPGHDLSTHHQDVDFAAPAAAVATTATPASSGVTGAVAASAAAPVVAVSPAYAGGVAASAACSLCGAPAGPWSPLHSSSSAISSEQREPRAAAAAAATEAAAASEAAAAATGAVAAPAAVPSTLLQDSEAVWRQDGSSTTEEKHVKETDLHLPGGALQPGPPPLASAAEAFPTERQLLKTATASPAAAALRFDVPLLQAVLRTLSPLNDSGATPWTSSSSCSSSAADSTKMMHAAANSSAAAEGVGSKTSTAETGVTMTAAESRSERRRGNSNSIKDKESLIEGRDNEICVTQQQSRSVYSPNSSSVSSAGIRLLEKAAANSTAAQTAASEASEAAARASLQNGAVGAPSFPSVEEGEEEKTAARHTEQIAPRMNEQHATVTNMLQSLTQRCSSSVSPVAAAAAKRDALQTTATGKTSSTAAAAAAAAPCVAAALDVPAAVHGANSTARVGVQTAGAAPEEAAAAEEKNNWTIPAVEDFMLQLRRGELRGSHQTARRTAEVLRQVVDQHPWKTTQELVDIVKQLGRRFLRADPMEFLVSNVVRRILCIIRTEHYKQLRKRQPEDEDEDEEGVSEQQQLLQGLATSGSTGAHGDMTRLPVVPLEHFRSSPLRSVAMHASPFPGFPSRTADDPQQLLLPVPATVKHSIFEGISELVAEVDAAWEEGEDVRTACFSNGDCILTYGYSVAVERLLKALHRKNQGEGATHSSRKKKKKGRVRCSFQVLVLGGDMEQGGKKMAERLVAAGIKTAYVADAALLTVIHKVDKVLLGTRAILSSGGAVAVSGARYVAEAAKIYNRPVMVVAPLFKLTHLPLYDQHSRNQLLSPSAVLPDLPELKNVSVRIPKYDYIPDRLLAVFITEIGPVDPSCLFVLAQQRYDVEDLDLYAVV